MQMQISTRVFDNRNVRGSLISIFPKAAPKYARVEPFVKLRQLGARRVNASASVERKCDKNIRLRSHDHVNR
jgi:hypothetical protein